MKMWNVPKSLGWSKYQLCNFHFPLVFLTRWVISDLILKAILLSLYQKVYVHNETEGKKKTSL